MGAKKQGKECGENDVATELNTDWCFKGTRMGDSGTTTMGDVRDGAIQMVSADLGVVRTVMFGEMLGARSGM